MKPSIFWRAFRLSLVALIIATSLAACAPRTRTPQAAPITPPPAETPAPPPEEAEPAAPPETPPEESIVLTDPVALETDRVAREAFHLMELSYLETGTYSANVMISDLVLPGGVRWMLEDLSETSYTLRFTSDDLPAVAWFVSPDGVTARQVDDNRIY